MMREPSVLIYWKRLEEDSRATYIGPSARIYAIGNSLVV
jgi:hypothetical protein